jgi:hypothetical protein
MTMRIAKDFGQVRIVHAGDPMNIAFDIRVEWLQDGEWTLYHGFNSFSDDYAFANSQEAATRAVAKLARQATEQLS